MIRATGYIVPKPDERDYQIQRLFSAKKITATPKGSADLSWQVIDVLDQGSLGSCTLNGITQMVRMRAMADSLDRSTPLGSRLFAYFNTRALDGEDNINEDTGADPRTAMKAINEYGLPPEMDWPYDIAKFKKLPANRAFRSAYDASGKLTKWEFYWITGSLDEKVEAAQLALDAGYAIGIGTAIGEEYGDWHKGDAPLGPPKEIAGYHFEVLDGYKGEIFRSLGSWSSGFGDNGRVEMTSDYVGSYLTSSMLVIEKGAQL